MLLVFTDSEIYVAFNCY